MFKNKISNIIYLQKFQIVFLFVLVAFHTNAFNRKTYQREEFPNLVNLNFSSYFPTKNGPTFISDLGAWHVYSQPVDKSEYGSFNGPYFIKLGAALLPNGDQQILVPPVPSRNFAKVLISEANKVYDPAKALKATFTYYPGLAVQKYEFDDLELSLRLIYIDSATAFIETTIRNKSLQSKKLNVQWAGQLNDDFRGSLQASANRVVLNFADKKTEFYSEWFNADGVNFKSKILNQSFLCETDNAITLLPNSEIIINRKDVFIFDKTQIKAAAKTFNPSTAFAENKSRWDNYINKILSHESVWFKQDVYRRLAVKSLLVLISNWRCAAGDILHSGIMPSITTFDGFWGWDTWKQAVACSYFEPELAKSSILSMYDYQGQNGMITDCIFSNKSRNIDSNTKPPLSAWAVWSIFKNTNDIEFLKLMYPKIIKFHQWWYTDRDINSNLLCEYGSTTGVLLTAKWESGMDNAVRFDNSVLLKKYDKVWSLNQESVDLNAYLFYEKLFLQKMAVVLQTNDGKQFKNEALKIQKKVNRTMYDKASGYYYDAVLNQKSLVDIQGTEAFTPLWSGLATKKQAQKVIATIMDTNRFNTYLPFPTCSAREAKFESQGYWRGRVWFDQAAFGLEGMKRYGYKAEADALFEKLMKNSEDLLTDGAIRENYDPLTGKGLGAYHFGWSASHLLLLLMETTND
jgi:putative isomerase